MDCINVFNSERNIQFKNQTRIFGPIEPFSSTHFQLKNYSAKRSDCWSPKIGSANTFFWYLPNLNERNIWCENIQPSAPEILHVMRLRLYYLSEIFCARVSNRVDVLAFLGPACILHKDRIMQAILVFEVIILA